VKRQGKKQRRNCGGRGGRAPAWRLKESGEDFFSTAERKPTPADQKSARLELEVFNQGVASSVEKFTPGPHFVFIGSEILPETLHNVQ